MIGIVGMIKNYANPKCDDDELQNKDNEKAKHLIAFQHIPPFVDTPNEGRKAVFDHKELSFNFANPQERLEYLKKLKHAKLEKLFCGHFHQNAGGWNEDLEVVVTTALGCQLGKDESGFRIVIVREDEVEYSFYPLKDVQTHVKL